MSRYVFSIAVLLIFSFLVTGGAPAANSQDPLPVIAQQAPPAEQPVSKVKPDSKPIQKVKPAPLPTGILRYSPLYWGIDCCLPAPAKGQMVLQPRMWFARLDGQVSKGGATVWGLNPPDVVSFRDHLGIKENAYPVWQLSAHYQLLPRWAIRYSFSPVDVQATNTARASFTFRGRNFTAGTSVRSRWERYEHRAGLVFDLRQTPSFVTSIYGEWLHIQDRITIGQTFAPGFPAVQWDEDKNVALMGFEVHKCIKNYRGSTLAVNCKGGVAFLADYFGYEAEAAIDYLIPIREGRFGFVKGGYRYAHLKKDKETELFSTTMDGAFVEVGVLF